MVVHGDAIFHQQCCRIIVENLGSIHILFMGTNDGLMGSKILICVKCVTLKIANISSGNESFKT